MDLVGLQLRERTTAGDNELQCAGLAEAFTQELPFGFAIVFLIRDVNTPPRKELHRSRWHKYVGACQNYNYGLFLHPIVRVTKKGPQF